ncbi:hypothetical protein F5Y08DRAFT_109311 [Xylaria arbuscula]|nr:hypothetical protein F5Y08DRAFT_109311 [Xylaria arbuscula]
MICLQILLLATPSIVDPIHQRSTMSHLYVTRNFKLPPGPSARKIIFVAATHGLAEHAKQLGVRTATNVSMAVSMALIAFGRHPDKDDDVRKTLMSMLGASSDSEGESVAARIIGYHAPEHVKTVKHLIEWYLNSIYPATARDKFWHRAWCEDEVVDDEIFDDETIDDETAEDDETADDDETVEEATGSGTIDTVTPRRPQRITTTPTVPLTPLTPTPSPMERKRRSNELDTEASTSSQALPSKYQARKQRRF